MHRDKHFIHTTGSRNNGVKCGLFEKIGQVLVVALRNNGVVIKTELRTKEEIILLLAKSFGMKGWSVNQGACNAEFYCIYVAG